MRRTQRGRNDLTQSSEGNIADWLGEGGSYSSTAIPLYSQLYPANPRTTAAINFYRLILEKTVRVINIKLALAATSSSSSYPAYFYFLHSSSPAIIT